MTSKRESHPLRRWAPVSPHQKAACENLAPTIAKANDRPLHDVICAVIEYSDVVWESLYHANRRTREAAIIEDLSWRKAMSDQLRLLHHRSPDETPRRILRLANLLHQIPTRKLQLSSILLALPKTDAGHTQLTHLTRLAPVLRDYYDDIPYRTTYAYNKKLVNSALNLVAAQCLTPKQLDIELNKALGLTPPGRPRK